jgi:hypothetical protein
MTMIVYVGTLRDNPVACEVRHLDCGAGRITCLECGGDGDWTKYHPTPERGPFPCVVCKGTGFVLVSV